MCVISEKKNSSKGLKIACKNQKNGSKFSKELFELIFVHEVHNPAQIVTGKNQTYIC
jgi:hypothetical protein